MSSPARLPSPTLRVEEGDHVTVTLYNTHYLPHTIHLHGTSQYNNQDGVPHMTQAEVPPGKSFTYRFVAKVPGTFWYHCHVQEQAHVGMGLAGMLVIEPNRPANHFAHLIPGAGRITSLAKATREEYQNEYSLVYMDIDDRLHRIPAAYRDPREIEKRMHRDYDVTQRRSNIFLLNGRAFPFTLRDSPIVVNSDEMTRLRVLNVGPRTVFLHTHGHHPTLTHLDGYPVPKDWRITRDTFDIGPAQRVDLALRTGSDGYYAVGPGVWLMHDHAQPAATNKGINPGGDHTAIVYSEFLGPDGLPRDHVGHSAHAHFFDPAYYQGKVPVFDPKIFGTTEEHYARGWPAEPPAGGAFDYPVREPPAALPRLDLIDAERHRAVASACPERPRGVRRIHVKAGRQYAREGEVFAFEPRELHAERCEEVEIVLENNDEIRHDLMIPGLNPIFAINFVGPDTEFGAFRDAGRGRDAVLPLSRAGPRQGRHERQPDRRQRRGAAAGAGRHAAGRSGEHGAGRRRGDRGGAARRPPDRQSRGDQGLHGGDGDELSGHAAVAALRSQPGRQDRLHHRPAEIRHHRHRGDRARQVNATPP